MGELRIKAWHAILIVVALVLFAIGATVVVTRWVQQVDTSRYTADQVIAVVHAYYPYSKSGSVLVHYEGGGIWYVRVGSQTGNFYENIGRLEGLEYNPTKPPEESGRRERPSWIK